MSRRPPSDQARVAPSTGARVLLRDRRPSHSCTAAATHAHVRRTRACCSMTIRILIRPEPIRLWLARCKLLGERPGARSARREHACFGAPFCAWAPRRLGAASPGAAAGAQAAKLSNGGRPDVRVGMARNVCSAGLIAAPLLTSQAERLLAVTWNAPRPAWFARLPAACFPSLD